jgi:alpha-ribazole phosphatase/probable phosphoglycerate mutase
MSIVATRLYLIRHGQVVGHDEYRYNGSSDVDITDTGAMQMERLAEYLSQEPFTINAMYSSDLQRAVKGARIIGKRLGIDPVMVHAIRELNLGRWEGLTREEASRLYPEESSYSFKDLTHRSFKGGESLLDLRQRVIPAINGIISRHPGCSACIVAHGGVNRVILADAMGLGPENLFNIEQDYGCLNVIDYFSDGFRVVKMLNAGPNQTLRPTMIY